VTTLYKPDWMSVGDRFVRLEWSVGRSKDLQQIRRYFVGDSKSLDATSDAPDITPLAMIPAIDGASIRWRLVWVPYACWRLVTTALPDFGVAGDLTNA